MNTNLAGEDVVERAGRDECFTVVFRGNVRRLETNPFQTETPFGVPCRVGDGDAFDELHAAEERAIMFAGGCGTLTNQLLRASRALQIIAEGKTPPDQHGHYLAHREAVRIAREALAALSRSNTTPEGRG